ncbi:hypothetical protein MACK_000105 [Theileria orientalis]|uniref:Uncharacterized protein n=1 Tax=Theileria orientalis TaxID=68886 RepID=A0A976QTQ9_THEOR|nr:hypothetical protein MACK_000105 [Theileria orientalis]
MNKLTHFEDLVNYCLNNKDTLGKRDIIASLSYMKTLKNFNLASKNFLKYNEFVLDNLSKFDSSIHLLIHRYAILGYNTSLISIYDKVLINVLGNLENKALCLIAWSYAKNNVFIDDLFETIATLVLNRDCKLNLTDLSLLLWSFAKINRRVPHEILKIKNEFLEIIKSIYIALSNGLRTDEKSQGYFDSEGSFYSNVVHDICMGVKSLAVLLPRDVSTINQILVTLFDITTISNLAITSQGLTSLWEALQYANIKDEEILEKLCEHSRYLRLDHSFNSNMLTSILTSVHKLKVKDPRIIYQIVHWLEKRSTQMHPQQMYTTISLLDSMCVYHDKAWKQLGVVVQKKAIDLELKEIRNLYNIFKRNGKGNDRIFGILDHFVSCKQDIEQYGFT